MSLAAVNSITADLADPLTTPVVKAVQEDVASRYIEIALVQNGEPLSLPAGTHGIIGIRRPNGTCVLYDADENGNDAVTFDGNVATAYLSQEALAVAGSLYMSVSLYDGDARLTAFHILVDVECTAVPSGVVVESDYFNILESMIDTAVDAADRAEAAIQTLTNATTSQAGIVQLVDGIASTSVTMAPTANAMRMVEPKKKTFANTTVATSSFVADATYAAFPYRAAVALTGVDVGMLPEVVFDAEDAMSGAFAPVATAYFGGVYIYSTDVPDAAVTIPTIIVWEG